MKKIINDLFKIILGNGFKLVAAILTGILLPLIFDHENYGYYRLFILYNTYFALFHFGFTDGIYLKYGGETYDKVDKSRLFIYTKFIFVFELILTIILLIISILFLDGERKIIFILLSINLLAYQFSAYFQLLSQALSRFKEFSIRNIIFSILSIILVFIFIFFKIDNYVFFIIGYITINYILLVWYVFTYKEISFIQSVDIIDNKDYTITSVILDIKLLFKIGLPLLVANLISVLIINLSRQFVDVLYNIETFAVFSFSYSLMSLVNFFVVAISTVIYPVLKKIELGKLKEYYNKSISLILVISMFGVSMYFPLEIVVKNIVPEYTDSLLVLKVIFPGIVMTSTVQIVKSNYFKALGRINDYLISGLITLIISFGITYLGYKIYGSITAIAASSVISFFIWYLLTELFFVKLYNINPNKNIIFMLIGISAFYVSFIFDNIYISFLSYLVFLLVLSLIFFKRIILKIIKEVV